MADKVADNMTRGPALPPGCRHSPGALSPSAQRALAGLLDDAIAVAPLFRPTMPRTGTPFSVEMTNFGPLGWVSDKSGYRYQAHHPTTGQPWPPIPPALLSIWTAHAMYPLPPEACLVNLYAPGARMGSHVDRDEADFAAPVVSISLGAPAIFHVGGLGRSGPKTRVRLDSGDVFVLGGASRLAHHGIDRLLPSTSDLIPGGARINITMRRVTKGPG